MTKRIKFFVLTIVMALGFFLCCGLVSVSADDGSSEPAEQVNALVVGVYEYAEEGKGNAKFTLYSNNTFEVEAHDLASDETIVRTGTYTLNGDLLEISNGVDTSIKFKIANGNQLILYEVATEQEEEVSEEVADFFITHLKQLKWDEFEAIIGWLIAFLITNAGVIVGLLINIVLKKTAQAKESKAFKEALAKMTLEQQEQTQKLINNFEDQLKKVYDENQLLILEYQEKLEALTNDQTKEIAVELSKVTDYLKEDK